VRLPRCRRSSAALASVLTVMCVLIASLPASAEVADSGDDVGTISGKVTDPSGRPIVGAVVSTHPVPDPLAGAPEPSPWEGLAATTTDAQGRYTLATAAGPTMVAARQNGFSTAYAVRASRWQDATPVDVVGGATVGDVDFVLHGLPPVNRDLPIIVLTSSAQGVGHPYLVDEGFWHSTEGTALTGPFSYQWYHVVGGQRIPIPGATARRYTPTSADLHKIVTVVVSLSHAGSAPTSVEAIRTVGPILRYSQVKVTSFTSPKKRTIRLTGVVTVTGVDRPSGGRVKAYCSTSDNKSYSSRAVALKNGKVTIMLKTKKIGTKLSRRTTARCSMVYRGDADTRGNYSSRSKTFKVRAK
jgi:hypothetical protein